MAVSDIAIPINIRFWLYVLSLIMSMICSLFVLCFFLFDRHLRRSLHNHVIITLLIINFIALTTDVPWIIYYYLHEVVWIFTPFFCRTWKFLDSVTYVTIAKLVALASIERYILIFHDQWLATKRRRLLLHYLPISIIVIYGITIYLIIHYFISCNRSFNSKSMFCGFYSCAYDSKTFTLFEFFSGGITNSIIIITFSITLVVRVVRQKHRLNQRINWRKQRKLVIQLLSITLLFYIFYLPTIVAGMLTLFGITSTILTNMSKYGQFFSFYINFFLPIVCAGTLPHLKMKLKSILKCQNVNNRVVVIAPAQNPVLRTRLSQYDQRNNAARLSMFEMQAIKE